MCFGMQPLKISDRNGNDEISAKRHNREIHVNRAAWQRRPLLRDIYRDFHRQIAARLAGGTGYTVEVGSGMGSIKEIIPACITD